MSCCCCLLIWINEVIIIKRERWNGSGVYEWGWRATTKGCDRF